MKNKTLLITLIFLLGIHAQCLPGWYENSIRFLGRAVFNTDPVLKSFATRNPKLNLGKSFYTGYKAHKHFKVCFFGDNSGLWGFFFCYNLGEISRVACDEKGEITRRKSVETSKE